MSNQKRPQIYHSSHPRSSELSFSGPSLHEPLGACQPPALPATRLGRGGDGWVAIPWPFFSAHEVAQSAGCHARVLTGPKPGATETDPAWQNGHSNALWLLFPLTRTCEKQLFEGLHVQANLNGSNNTLQAGLNFTPECSAKVCTPASSLHCIASRTQVHN